LHCPVLV